MSKTLLLLILTVCAIPVASQTASEIEKEFGQPTSAYSVSEHIWMTPDFAADGQVCRMRFYPKRFYRNTAYPGDGHLKFPELKWVLNQIVPPASRGNKKDGFGLGSMSGSLAQTRYEYEKVTFTFGDSFRIDPEALKQSDPVLLDGFDLTDFPPAPKPPMTPSESDFDQAIGPQMVILQWNDRTCPQDSDAAPPDYQGVAEIEQRFGPAQKIYSVTSYTSISAAFDADGQVCQMWVYPKRVSGDKSYLVTELQFVEVLSFLNRFVPPEERGLKQKVNFGTTTTGGGSARTTYPYQEVYFTFMSPIPLKKYDGSLLREEESRLTMPKSPQPKNKDRSPSFEDFRRIDDAQVVHVRWLKRTCVQ